MDNERGKDTLNSFQPEPIESTATAMLSRQQLLGRLEAARVGARGYRLERDFAREVLLAIAQVMDVRWDVYAGTDAYSYDNLEAVKQKAIDLADEVRDLRRVNGVNRMALLRANLLAGYDGQEDAA